MATLKRRNRRSLLAKILSGAAGGAGNTLLLQQLFGEEEPGQDPMSPTPGMLHAEDALPPPGETAFPAPEGFGGFSLSQLPPQDLFGVIQFLKRQGLI